MTIILGVLILSSLGIHMQESFSSGIKKQDIPEGDEDLYLKNEIVPPVCPKCPDSRSCPRPKPCPLGAPCARCPEPAFECKKVPNYSAASNSMLPTAQVMGMKPNNVGGGSLGGHEPIPRLSSLLIFNLILFIL